MPKTCTCHSTCISGCNRWCKNTWGCKLRRQSELRVKNHGRLGYFSQHRISLLTIVRGKTMQTHIHAECTTLTYTHSCIHIQHRPKHTLTCTQIHLVLALTLYIHTYESHNTCKCTHTHRHTCTQHTHAYTLTHALSTHTHGPHMRTNTHMHTNTHNSDTYKDVTSSPEHSWALIQSTQKYWKAKSRGMFR